MNQSEKSTMTNQHHKKKQNWMGRKFRKGKIRTGEKVTDYSGRYSWYKEDVKLHI